jgi:hypothetical protein
MLNLSTGNLARSYNVKLSYDRIYNAYDALKSSPKIYTNKGLPVEDTDTHLKEYHLFYQIDSFPLLEPFKPDSFTHNKHGHSI